MICSYLKAFEVGYDPTSPKYELAISLRTRRNGPVIRSRMRLPHSVDTSQRIAVICPPGSQAAEDAKQAGAKIIEEDKLLEDIKEGKIEFDRLICHQDSVAKLNKANLGRILGPRGLMPNTKTGTITRDIIKTVKTMVGGTEYREKIGVIRLAIGQLAFTPKQMEANIKAFMANLKKDINQLNENVVKEIHEVVRRSKY
jgi:large subunit ribosomal protein L1